MKKSHCLWLTALVTSVVSTEAPAWSDTMLEEARPGGGGAEDLLGITKFPPGIVQGKQNSAQLTSSCTDSNGNTYTSEEPGFSRCLQQKHEPDLDAPAPVAKPKGKR